jgi:predicted type IV restriction endonuclease
MNLEDAFKKVSDLVADFDKHKGFYLTQEYQEQEARRDFIDKFWIALGWDVNHESQKNPYEQEVKVERKDHAVSQRKADYAFYLSPNFRDVQFYVEAKKPYGDIGTPDNYFQIVRYGWHSDTKVGVLHDFEQFEIVDTRRKPDLETAEHQVIKKYRYQDYLKKDIFSEIYYLFSKEALLGNSLNKYVEQLPKKKGLKQLKLLGDNTERIDSRFLEMLDTHRATLAKAIKSENPSFDGDILTELVQRILDRLVFIRFLEDKLIEPRYIVSEFGLKKDIWSDFIIESRRLDSIYNGIVFKKNEILDSETFLIDKDLFSSVCEDISHKNTIFDFNLIPIHILGSIYERFLGKKIEATAKRVTIESKNKVRKASGIYYTPEEVVNFIVEETLSPLLKNKSPSQVDKLKIIDIACGSGSFLLGVYDYLIRFYTKYYNENPTKAKKGDLVEREDGYHLSFSKKRDILINNVFGVDIDSQAVEVAQLSLYLKLLAEETPASARNFQMEFHQTLLPALNKNIVCGNSLIGTNIYTNALFPSDQEKSLNPFDFSNNFLDIIKDGGFDLVLGNPPYLNVDDEWGKNDVRLSYLKENYPHIYNDKTDILFYFFAKAADLSKDQVGFIVSRAYLQAYKADKLRMFLLSKFPTLKIYDFQNYPIFEGVGITTCITFLSKNGKDCQYYKLNEGANPFPLNKKTNDFTQRFSFYEVPKGALSEKPWEFTSSEDRSLNNKIDKNGEQIGNFLQIGKGMETGLNNVFGSKTKEELKELGFEVSNCFRRARNSDIESFTVKQNDQWLIYNENLKDFSDLPKKAQAYFEKNKSELKARAAFERGDCEWWKYTFPLSKNLYHKKRIICPYLAQTNRFALIDNENILGLTDTTVIFDNNQKESMEYLVALLNSSLLTFRFKSIGKMKGGGVLEYFWNSISKIPVKRINFDNKNEKDMHNKISLLSTQIIATKKSLNESKSDKDKTFYKGKYESLFKQINDYVFILYNIDQSERDLIIRETSDLLNK